MLTISRSATAKAKLIAMYKANAKDDISEVAGDLRTFVLGKIPGENSIWSEKEAEARDYISQSPAPSDLTDYPFIEAEIGRGTRIISL